MCVEGKLTLKQARELIEEGRGDLDLCGMPVTELPQGLVVPKNLFLRCTMLEELPQFLTVGRDLDITGTAIKELPHFLFVGGDIYHNWGIIPTRKLHGSLRDRADINAGGVLKPAGRCPAGDTYDIDGDFYVAYGWNGEKFLRAYRTLDTGGLTTDWRHPNEYTLTPIHVFEAEGKSWGDVEKFEENSDEWNRLVSWSGFDISEN